MRKALAVLVFFSLVVAMICTGAAGTAEAAIQHTVARGETVWLIAQHYGTTVAAISQANGLTNPAMIYPGQVLTIPVTIKHTVRAGDTVWKIAQKYGSSVAAIAQANNMSNPANIYPGQVLVIPEGGGTVSRGGRVDGSELDLFARLVYAEAAGEPYVGQVAVAASVLNRVKSPEYPNTISGVILQISNGYYQYSPVQDGRIYLPANQAAYNAVNDALNGWDPSLGATGFYNPAKTTNWWVRSRPVTTVIGNHVFFR